MKLPSQSVVGVALLNTGAALNILYLKLVAEGVALQPAPVALCYQRGQHPCRGDTLLKRLSARQEIGHIFRGFEGLCLARYFRVQVVSGAPGFQHEHFWKCSLSNPNHQRRPWMRLDFTN